MKLIKAFGLTALAVVAVMAFVGTASAQADKEIMLCFTEEVLCTNKGWSDKLMVGLAEEVSFLDRLT